MIRRIFPSEYSLDEIKKYKTQRSRQFNDFRDAFQQLVGDALIKSFGTSAFVSPTRGEDGSIDAYIDNYIEELKYPFENLELPIIIECKSHEPSVNLVRNIKNEWAKLRIKLEEQAEKGWDDLFGPWKSSKSYVYCVSANITSKDFHQKLTEKISDFFEKLPEDNRPPIEKVLVLDWKMLKVWFDNVPELCDLWLGIDSSLIMEHQTFKSSLNGFRRFLLPDRLGFVEPEIDSLFHPQNIFNRLTSEEEKNNILLIGAGGVGKTRTSTEVGELAEREGWRVLHVLAGEPGVENEHLAEAVLPFTQKTLLIFDYIDQMNQLDLGYIRRTLIPTGKERGVQIAVLANSRPGWIKYNKENFERDELFQIIELKTSDAQRKRIVDKVVAEIAPVACQKLGDARVKELCGSRAIIALLIALELERLAAGENFSTDKLTGIKSGDLVSWLRRRLSGDKVTVKSEDHGFEMPESWLVISASVLACGPGDFDFLLDIADAVKKNSGSNTNTEYLIKTLIDLGWLEKNSGYFSTPHDVVADEVFDQAVHHYEIVHEKELYQVLSPSLIYPRSFGRFAVTFERVLGAIQDKEHYERLKRTAEKWLTENADKLGQTLTDTDSDVSGYSIGAVLGGDLWRDVAIENWTNLIQPWLERHGMKLEARHLLYKGLKKIASLEKIDLISTVLLWLNKFAKHSEASYVNAPLLSRKELKKNEAEEAIGYAFQWLRTDDHSLTSEARFILPPLLSRKELKETEVERAITYALQWLKADNHSLIPEASYVLPSLLSRKELKENEAEEAIAYAFQWLKADEHSLTLEAGFVLPSLLGRRELKETEVERAITYALQWLKADNNFLKLDAQFVFNQLLGRKELKENEAEEAIGYAFQWLKADEHSLTLEAGFVLPSLLGRRELKENEAEEAITYAFQWLKADEHSLTPEASYVLPPLLGRKELKKTEAKEAIGYAFQWLKTDDHSLTSEARFILPPLLSRKELKEAQAERAITYALQWLKADNNFLKLDAQFVFNQLLGRKELKENEAEEAIGYAFQWLKTDDYSLTSEAGFVLPPLLGREELKENEAEEAIGYAFQWLKADEHSLTLEAGFVLPPLLLYLKENDSRAGELIKKSLQWLEEFFDTQDAEFVIKRLSIREELNIEKVENLIRSILVRLQTRINDEEATYLIRWCLQRKIEDENLNSERVKFAVDWLKNNEENINADFVWNRVLRNDKTEETDWIDISAIALSWLKSKQISEKKFDRTINSVLVRPNLLSRNDFYYVLEKAIQWIKANRNKLRWDDIKKSYGFVYWAIENRSDKSDVSDLIDEFNKILEQKKSAYKFFQVQALVKERAEDLSFSPSLVEIKEICEVIDEQKKYSIKSAAYVIVPLLIIGLRTEAEAGEIIGKTVSSLMSSEELPAKIKEKIKQVFSSELDELGIILSSEQEKWLERGGIIQPAEMP